MEKGITLSKKGGKFSLRAAYLLYWSAAAAFVPYMSVYFESNSLSGRQIGLLISIPYLVTVVSSLLLSYISDLVKKPALVLQVCTLGFIAAVVYLPSVSGFLMIAFFYFLYAVSSAPMNPILDEITLGFLEDPSQYGKIRLGGSIGWGGTVLIVSYFLYDWNFNNMFLAARIIMILFFVNTFRIPKNRILSHQNTVTLKQLGKFIRKRGVSILLASNVIWAIAEASLTGFLFLHIKGLGGNSVIMGFSMATALLCELLCFMVIDKIESRFKLSNMILAAFVCQFLRLFFLFIIKDPILLIPFQFIGGASFALIWSASVAYINKHADKEISTTAQALKTCATSIGAGISAILGGWIYEIRGSTNLFLYLSIMLLTALVIGLQIYQNRKWVMRNS